MFQSHHHQSAPAFKEKEGAKSTKLLKDHVSLSQGLIGLCNT